MALTDPTTASIAHVIQLAVAPVFLLSGIGALLGVLTNRLARIVDRARKLESEVPAQDDWRLAALRARLKGMARRARLISWSISLCTGGALLICGVIVALFVGSFVDLNVGSAVAGLFVAAMLCLICALLFFLREIYLATQQLRIGEPEEPQPPLVTAVPPAEPAVRAPPAR